MRRKKYTSSTRIQNFENLRYHGTTELVAGEKSLTNYNNYIVNCFIKFSGVRESKSVSFSAMDFGAGIGTLAQIWSSKTQSTLMCVEIDSNQADILRSRGFEVQGTINENSSKYDFIYSSNVLEHIEDDLSILKSLNASLKCNGRIGIYVPAFEFLFSDLDLAVGHFRRYRKKDLSSKLTKAGFRPLRIRYVDSLGFPASLILRLLGFKSKLNIGGDRSLRLYDRYIFPVSIFFDKIGFQFILGKNLFVIAEKCE
jgi:SAM-dependent methyltransferase